MFSSCLRYPKSGNLRSADSFWSSRSRVVYILQEELKCFLKEIIMSYFRVQMVHFHKSSFHLYKTEVRGPKSCVQDAIIGLGGALMLSPLGPLGQPRESFGRSWALLGVSWGIPGLSCAFLGLHQRPRQHDESPRKPKRGEVENP